MGRPLKDRTGMDERWRFTTVRVPRWLADQVRDLSRDKGHDEVWEVLLQLPGVSPPAPMPPRFAHLDAQTLPPIRVPPGVAPEDVVSALDAAGETYVRTPEGFLPAGTYDEAAAREDAYQRLTARIFAVRTRG